MSNIPSLRSIVAALLVAAMSLPAAAQSVVGKGKTGPATRPSACVGAEALID